MVCVVYKLENPNVGLKTCLELLDNIDLGDTKNPPNELSMPNLYNMENRKGTQNMPNKPGRLSRIKNGVVNFYREGYKWKIPLTLAVAGGVAYAAGYKGIGYNVKELVGPGFQLDFTCLYPFSHLRTLIADLGKQVGYNVGKYAVGSWVHTTTPESTMNFNRLVNAVGNGFSVYTLASGIRSLVKRYGKK